VAIRSVVVERQRVVMEKNRANEQRAAAEDLVDFMLVDLRKRLKRLGKLEVLDAVAGKVDAFYRRLELAAVETKDATTALRRKAQAFSFLSAIRLSQANAAAALAAQQQSVAIERRLSDLEPRS